MSVRRDAKRAHKALTAEQQAFTQNPVLDGVRTPAGWLEFLDPIAAADAVRDEARTHSHFFGVGLPADVPNHLREAVIPFMRVLGEELEPGDEVSVHLDLRGPHQGDKARPGPHYDQGRFRYPKVQTTFYVDQWFAGGAALTDGSRLQWSVVDTVRHRRITKRSTSGKIKTKSKDKVRRRLEVLLAVRQNSYRLAPTAEQAIEESVDAKTGEKRTVVRVRREFDAPAIGHGMGLDPLLDAVSESYRHVVSVEAAS